MTWESIQCLMGRWPVEVSLVAAGHRGKASALDGTVGGVDGENNWDGGTSNCCGRSANGVILGDG